MPSANVVTRFAPSPTGHLHVGGARSALFCWAYARRMDGRFMIRIEDTDAARSSNESARGILDDLAWLGLTWDDGPTLGDIGANSRPVGPFFQAQRKEMYNAYIEHLFDIGRAYPAFETNEELDKARKEAAARKATFKYPRPADVQPGVRPTERIARALGAGGQPGERHVVRFVMPDHGIAVHDQVLGDVKFAAGEVDDFVIRKADGLPTYHFAVVIDDELMGVTHVLRAQEHLINTPRHVAMQETLTRLNDDRNAANGTTGARFRTPVYAHMPLICNIDGSKMSKRDKAKAARKAVKDAMVKAAAGGGAPMLAADVAAKCGLDVATVNTFLSGDSDQMEIAEALAGPFNVNLPEIEVWDYRASGYMPEAIVNFLGLLGWSTGEKMPDGKDKEKFDAAYLAGAFSIERIHKQSAKFDRVKLLSFNGDYVAALSDGDFDARVRAWAGVHRPEFGARWAALSEARRTALIGMAKGRTKIFSDLPKVVAFALVADTDLAYDAAAVAKHIGPSGSPGRGVLEAFTVWAASDWSGDAAAVDGWIKARAEATGLKMGDIAQPLRVALSGGTASPPLGDVAAVLGKASVLTRVQRALSPA
ncbi:MAG: glutamate--tRNA ligase [Phycisphaerales bacterium]